ncbi:MAG: hypothetical protein ISR65_17105 [Bacteriovoracaceae bacterium]|nr:hypothetical protein [Bacteriovoracaceae bacterium]
MKLLITIFFVFFVTSKVALAAVYMDATGNYGTYNLATMKANNVQPTGIGWGFALGVKKKFVEFELFFNSAAYESELIHDSVNNTLIHSQNRYGVGFNFSLGPRLYIRVGYALHTFSESLETAVDSAIQTEINTQYGMLSKKTDHGEYLGVGIRILNGKRFQMFASADRYNYVGVHAYEVSFMLGLRMIFKKSPFGSFIKLK